MLLANADIRNRDNEEYDEVSIVVGVALYLSSTHLFVIPDSLVMLLSFLQLNPSTVTELMDKTFKNYYSWCKYLHCKSNLRYVTFLI